MIGNTESGRSTTIARKKNNKKTSRSVQTIQRMEIRLPVHILGTPWQATDGTSALRCTDRKGSFFRHVRLIRPKQAYKLKDAVVFRFQNRARYTLFSLACSFPSFALCVHSVRSGWELIMSAEPRQHFQNGRLQGKSVLTDRKKKQKRRREMRRLSSSLSFFFLLWLPRCKFCVFFHSLFSRKFSISGFPGESGSAIFLTASLCHGPAPVSLFLFQTQTVFWVARQIKKRKFCNVNNPKRVREPTAAGGVRRHQNSLAFALQAASSFFFSQSFLDFTADRIYSS